MNFFYPSLLVFVISLVILYSVIPRFTPLIMLILAAGLLAFGIYHHYSIFKNEYMKTTWTDGLKMYAPAIMIGFVIILIFYGIFAFFARGAVPVPISPEIPSLSASLTPPSPNMNLTKNATKNVTSAAIGSPVTAAVNTVTNIANTIGSGISRATTGAANAVTNFVNNVSGNRKNTRTIL
ncbi:MAG: hypothetical protein EBT86_03070 [Actinobacteria bacterium]|nr:hypothetical protein [Actinomycetota bacterium]